MSEPLHGLPLGPVIERNNSNAVITGKSHDFLQTGQFNNVPIFIGHTSLEANSNDALIGKYIKCICTIIKRELMLNITSLETQN